MKLTHLSLLISLIFSLPATPCLAGKAAGFEPRLAKPGKAVVEDNFDAAPLARQWVVNKGDWQIKDGAVVGNVKKSDNHPAVMLLNSPNRNSIIRFSFKFEGGKGFNLSYNSARGHLFRVVVTGDGLTVSKDKDKKDAKSKSATLATANGKITPGEWHTMQVEVQGGKVAVQTDFGLRADVGSSELDMDKTGYRFVTGGSVTLDDVKVWQVE